jgi:hypothetical protein
MDVDEEPSKADAAAAGDKEAGEGAKGEGGAAAEGAAAAGDGKEKAAKEKEPSSYTLTAPCRVVPQQVKFVSFPVGEGGVSV